MRFCQTVRYFWLFSASESKIFTLSSIFFVGKMSVLFATDGSYFFAHSPAPATGAEANLLETRIAATSAWLAGAQPDAYAIQLLGANNATQLNQHLKIISKIIEINDLFVYRTIAKGGPSLTVVWGSFDSQRTAQAAMAQLPSFLKAYRPLLRTVRGIKTEVAKQNAS